MLGLFYAPHCYYFVLWFSSGKTSHQIALAVYAIGILRTTAFQTSGNLKVDLPHGKVKDFKIQLNFDVTIYVCCVALFLLYLPIYLSNYMPIYTLSIYLPTQSTIYVIYLVRR